MTAKENFEAFWNEYVQSLPEGVKVPEAMPEAWGFGDNPEMAEELGRLVLKGIKTATASAVWEYEAENEPFPRVGELSIITGSQGQPLCIIETMEVMIRPYNEVDAQFAFDEGEGDRTLEYWQTAHRVFFDRTLSRLGLEFTETMPLLLERFRVIYPKKS